MGLRIVALTIAAATVAATFSNGASAQYTRPLPRIDPSTVYVLANWCPTVRSKGELPNYYPKRALQREIEGVAVLDCTLTEQRTLQSCRVVREEPARIGFGIAALKVACTKMGETMDGPPGGQVELTVPYELNFKW
jgi:hypothetical protein